MDAGSAENLNFRHRRGASKMNYADSAFEIKQLNDSGAIEGLLAGFNTLDSHGDRIDAKAFTRTLAERGDRPIPMLLHHDPRRPVGAWQEWQERPDGLFVKGKLTLTARDAQEAYALARDGALTALSIGYQAKQAHRDQRTGERHLLDVELHEGSLVTIGSNPDTRVSSIKMIAGVRDIEDMLREGGLSGRKAKAAAGAAWRTINDSNNDQAAEDALRAAIARLQK
ncbi:hypothetical protein A9D14_04840 [Croceicoccus marinus]|uniref:Prohead serine protease domain-containing protein n=2 Tax=Croceicoccus marinus TaxID=450378 RepID=A0A1Z1FA18_9SPHN|nr:hypothetical protein A9D14_04840 [Croceicoccus marinus]